MTTTSSTDRIEKTVNLRAGIDRVWRALTDHEEFGEWFRVNIDGCGDTRWTSFIKDMKAPHYFSFTWHPYAVEAETDYAKEPQTLVEFKLEEIESGTKLTVIETGFDALPAERQPIALRMNTGGWEEQMRNIKEYLESK
jgi:uncharacterized protein YndB with AHSA1/START domain